MINQKVKLLTRKEVAIICEVSLSTIDRWMKQGKLNYFKIGRSVRFRKEQVMEDL